MIQRSPNIVIKDARFIQNKLRKCLITIISNSCIKTLNVLPQCLEKLTPTCHRVN